MAARKQAAPAPAGYGRDELTSFARKGAAHVRDRLAVLTRRLADPRFEPKAAAYAVKADQLRRLVVVAEEMEGIADGQ